MPDVFHADWVLPIAQPPIRDGWVAVDRGRIVGVGGPHDGRPAVLEVPPAFTGARDARDAVAILPGLVNAHTHLELSYLAGRVPPSARFTDWIKTIVATRRQYPDAAAPEILDAARDAIGRARASGTALVGDISNTLVTVPLLREAGMAATVFYELLGFNAPDADARVAAARAQADALDGADVRVTLAPHAPYSVSPPLFAAIRRGLDARPGSRTSVHLGESAEEVEFVRHASGGIRAALEQLGVWTNEWRAILPAGVSPVAYLNRLGFLDGSVLVVHGVQFDDEDLKRLRDAGATLVTCPRSNRHVGAGDPPVERFYASGVRVAVGTDSLASVEDLNVFAELAAMRRLAPSVSARRILESATRHGAAALGFGEELGTIEPGRRARLLAVRVPAGVADVEEYLLGGVQPDDIGWLNA